MLRVEFYRAVFPTLQTKSINGQTRPLIELRHSLFFKFDVFVADVTFYL